MIKNDYCKSNGLNELAYHHVVKTHRCSLTTWKNLVLGWLSKWFE